MKKILLSTLLLANGVAIASPFVVKEIRVDGVVAEDQSAIISTLPVKVGQTATDNDIANVVRQLFIQNRFDDVRAMREGNVLVIKVAARPLISSLDIEGNSAVPKDALTQNLKANLISKGEIYDRNKLEAFKQGLIEHYHSMGFHNAKVNVLTEPLENGRVKVKIQIDEDKVAYVKEINFEGNKAFTSKELIKLLDIQPNVPWWNILESSKYQQTAYEKDIETLRNFYLNQGYAKYVLEDADVKFSENKSDVYLTYKIHEGEKYSVSDIRIIGDTAKMGDELNKLLKDFTPGQQFKGDEIANIETGIKQILGDSGFISAKVELYPTFNEQDKTVKINFVVDAGRRVYVRNIRFTGNEVTADATLRREMRQQEGTWLSSSLMELSKNRLERTGFYETVEVSMENVPNVADQVDLVYHIKERSTGSINFGVSYGSESGLGYQASIKQDNFLGMGTSVSLAGQKTDNITAINLGYTEPYFTKDGVSLGGNIFYEDYNNRKQKNVANYQRQSYGTNLSLGFPVDEYNSYYIGIGYSHDNLKNIQREYNRELYIKSLKNFGEKSIDQDHDLYPKIKTDDFDFSFGWSYNSLNRGFLPTAGATASLGGKITIPGSDNSYYKLNASFAKYIPLNREHKWVVSARANFAYANGMSGRELPFFQTYSAGGIGSLRGFSYGTIGPKAIYWDPKANNNRGEFSKISYDVSGGNAMATATIELIVPTPIVSDKYQHNVRTSFFIDAATVWNSKWKQYNTSYLENEPNYENYGDYKRFRASTGIAFQWNSPVGPLLFSYAKPIRKYKGDEIERFQFSIGGSF